MTANEIFDRIVAERRRQQVTHTGNTLADKIPDSMKVTILVEEIGEVAKAVQDKDRDNLREELVQVAALAVAWLTSL